MAFTRISRKLRGAYHTIVQCLTCKKHGKKRSRRNMAANTDHTSTWIPSDLDVMENLTETPDAHNKPTKPTTATPMKQIYFTEGRDCVVCTESASKTNVLIAACQFDCTWCEESLAMLFRRAIACASDMPPRCCGVMIPLHFGLQYLTDEEAAKFRLAFEEWATAGKEKLYCPAKDCRKFIPMRAFGRDAPVEDTTTTEAVAIDTDKPKRDSGQDNNPPQLLGIKPEEVKQVTCPACTTSICTKCKSETHSLDQPCSSEVDEALTAQLRKWNYKPCPRCGHYIRRMHGCNHMVCLCGEHWCWGCGVRYQECEGYGECETDEEDDRESWAGSADYEFETDSEADRTNEVQVETIPAGPERRVWNTVTDENYEDSYEAYLRVRQAIECGFDGPDATEIVEPRRRRLRRRDQNLDAGTHAHWAGQNLDFGDEPGDDNHTTVIWDGCHSFRAFEQIKNATGQNYVQMECHMCWKVVMPERPVIEESKKSKIDIQEIKEKNKAVSKDAKAVDSVEQKKASQCRSCRLVVCEKCINSSSL